MTQPSSNPFASASICVKDLRSDITETTLFELFNAIGPVASIRVCRDAKTRRSLGYGYINFHSVQDAERAINTLNFTNIRGQQCRVMWKHQMNDLKLVTTPSKPKCKFFGSELGCRFGNKCNNSHDDPNSVAICKNFTSSAGCRFGKKCHFRHKDYKSDGINKPNDNNNNKPNKSTSVSIIGNKKGDGIDNEESTQICKFYNKSDGCKRGVSCRFRHVNTHKNDSSENKEDEKKDDNHDADDDEEEAIGDIDVSKQKKDDNDNVDEEDEGKLEITEEGKDDVVLNDIDKEKQEFKNWIERKVKLPEYYDIFIENGIETLEIIQLITEKEFIEMGITKIGHKLKILQEIKKLSANNEPQEGDTAYAQ